MKAPMWYHLRAEDSMEKLEEDAKRMRDSGLDAALAYVYSSNRALYSSKFVPSSDVDALVRFADACHRYDLEIHATLVALNCNSEDLMRDHPEWYMVSKEGISCIEKPPYIGGYRWLCPSRSQPREYLKRIVDEISSGYEVEGIHLDYIRYPDVILPLGIQPRYNLVQDREFPEYDYCYCDRCRELFLDEQGIDPLELKDGDALERWKEFRYRKVESLVDELGEIARSNGKLLSAAVFATPHLSREYVRQDWPKWNLDAAMPMIYQKYYEEDLTWIGTATAEGVEEVVGRFPIYAGMQMNHVEPEKLAAAIDYALDGGAAGPAIFCFGNSGRHWGALKMALKGAPKDFKR